jgi:nucleoside-diphosphate kinase
MNFFNPRRAFFVASSLAVVFYALAYFWAAYNFETTLVIIKPDGLKLGVKDAVYSRLRNELGLRLVAETTHDLATAGVLRDHYAEHIHRDFFDSLLQFMQSGPIAVSVWLGKPGTIRAVRELVGSTDPSKASPGTIRAMYGSSAQMNVIHASDGVDSARREIEVWFR